MSQIEQEVKTAAHTYRVLLIAVAVAFILGAIAGHVI